MKSQHKYLIRGILAGIFVSGPALGGLNGDGHLDAVFANLEQINQACLGDGAANFACSNVSADTGPSRNVGLGDVNADGAVDACRVTSVYMACDPWRPGPGCIDLGARWFVGTGSLCACGEGRGAALRERGCRSSSVG